jgi:hypothetical protein
MNCPKCDQRLYMLGCIFQEKGEFLTAGWCYNEKCSLHGGLIKFILKEDPPKKEVDTD